jgi:hypothetical protein
MTYSLNEYKKEDELLQRIALVESVYSENIVKNADVTEIFSKIFENIKVQVANRIKREGFGAALTYGIMGFVGWRMRALLIVIDQVLGISVGSLFSKAMNMAKEKITNTNGVFTNEDAIQIADTVTSEYIVSASFKPLYDLEKRGQLLSTLKVTAGKPNIVDSAFKTIGDFISGNKSAGKKLGGGIVRKLLAAILMGIALIEGPELIKSIITGTSPTPSQEEYSATGTGETGQRQTSVVSTISINVPPKQQHNLQSSGAGETYHINAGETRWIVPLYGDVKKTMLLWTSSVYPQLKGIEGKIVQLPSFNKMASILIESYNQNPGLPRYVVIPINTNLHTIKDIVDRYAGDASKLI